MVDFGERRHRRFIVHENFAIQRNQVACRRQRNCVSVSVNSDVVCILPAALRLCQSISGRPRYVVFQIVPLLQCDPPTRDISPDAEEGLAGLHGMMLAVSADKSVAKSPGMSRPKSEDASSNSSIGVLGDSQQVRPFLALRLLSPLAG